MGRLLIQSSTVDKAPALYKVEYGNWYDRLHIELGHELAGVSPAEWGMPDPVSSIIEGIGYLRRCLELPLGAAEVTCAMTCRQQRNP